MRVHTAMALALLALVGCHREEKSEPPPSASPPVSAAPDLPARVAWIEIGAAADPNGRVTAPSSQFTPKDTIYVSVLTDGQPSGSTLSARWTFEDGQVVSENHETLGPDRQATEFHIAKADGWPTGRYKVEIALNGQPAGSKEFEVR
ncbi:MAG TPA: hypothetical protein VMS55_01260 [Myxococcota bacterium]|nr:hypothetical protein [Myxococcota bacterium]